MWPWSSRQVQQPVKYHGLINHGSTCYLNSVLQVLFMTKEFREAVNRFVEENPDTQFIDRHLKDLFDDLLRHQAYTYKIIKALGINRVHEQQDAAEYFERILRQTSSNTAEMFHGQMAHRTTCSVCETESDRDGAFWHLPLELVDSSSGNYSVEDGINTYFRPTYLGGDNQMYCDTCDTKVNATSSYVIKHHPDVLILLLKRFDFSYRHMSYVKINCAVDVPYILTIPEDQTYELYGVVDHYGDLRSGHYIAKIKSQEDDEETWYSFDDTRVSQLDSSPFPDSVNITQSQRAYLLFYRKKVQQPVQQPVKYHGLINHGSTCYLNSVLQVLFMTKEFREAVNRFVEENPDTQFIDRHLKALFDDLLRHQSYTYKIIKALGINRVDEQQDAAEYFERILRQTSSNTAEMFHGQMAHRTTCSVCETESDRDGAFWHLPLELVDSSSGNYSVEDGINTYFRPTYLGGNNQMYCEACDTKVNATSRYVIKHHPDVLILLLKRFDFSYRYMSYVKINCSVDVPYTLTVPEDQTYELYGVVDHYGDLRSGHYIAKIKSQEDDEETWYSFDDTRVSQLASSPFPDREKVTQFQSAYLLLYKKKDTQEEGKISTNGDDVTKGSGEATAVKEEGNDIETQNKAKKRSLEITEKNEFADKKKKNETVKDPEKSNPDFTLGHRETSVGPAEATESKEKRTNSEQFVESGENGSQDERTSLKRKSMDKNLEDNQVEKKDQLDQSEIKESENNKQPETDNMRPDVKSGEREKSTLPSVQNRHDETGDGQSLLEIKTESKRIKLETDNHDIHLQDRTSQEENTNDQEEKDNKSCTGDGNEVKDPETSDQHEVDQMTPDMGLESKPVDSEESPSAAGHDRLEERRDVTDENKQTKMEVKLETENLACHSQDMQDLIDHKVSGPMKAALPETKEINPGVKQEARETENSEKQAADKLTKNKNTDDLNENSDLFSDKDQTEVRNLEKAKETDVSNMKENQNQEENRNLFSTESQVKVKDLEKSDIPVVDQVTSGEEENKTENSDSQSQKDMKDEDTEGQEDRTLPSSGDQNQPTGSEDSNPDVNQDFTFGHRETSVGPAGYNRQDGLSEAQRKLTDENKLTEQEAKHKTENSDRQAERETVNDKDSHNQKVKLKGRSTLYDYYISSLNKSVDKDAAESEKKKTNSEQFVEPAGHDSQDEMTGLEWKSMDKKSEENQAENKGKQGTENPESSAEHLEVKNPEDDDQEENKNQPLTEDQPELKEFENYKQPETENTRPDVKLVEREKSTLPPVHDRHDETGDGQGLLDKKTEDERKKRLQDMTAQDENTNDQEENRNLLFTGDQNKVSVPLKTGLPETKEISSDVKQERRETDNSGRLSDNYLSKNKNTDDLKENSDLVSNEDQAEVLKKANETEFENMGANLKQEGNRNLPSTGDQIDQRTPDGKQEFESVVPENLPVTASNNELDELNDALKKLTIETTEQTEEEEKHQTGISNFNSQNKKMRYSDINQVGVEHKEPAINQDLKHGDYEKTVEPAALHSGDEGSDVQKLTEGKKDENKQMETGLKHQTENSVRQTEDMRVKDEDQIKTCDFLSDGDLNKIKDSDNNTLTETKEMEAANHDFKPEDGETLAGHERQEDMGPSQGDLTDEMTEENKNQESETFPLPAQDTTVKDANSDDSKKEENLPYSGNHYELKGQMTLNMKHDTKPVDGDLLPTGNDRQSEKSDDSRIDIDLKAVDKNQTEEEEQYDAGTSNSQSQDVMMKNEDNDDQKENKNLISTNDENKARVTEHKELFGGEEMRADVHQDFTPGNGEQLVVPAGQRSHDERSDAQETFKNKMTEESKLLNKEEKHETENLAANSQEVQGQIDNDHQGDRTLPSDGDQSKVSDPMTTGLPETNEIKPDVKQEKTEKENSDRQRENELSTDKNNDDLKSDSDQVSDEDQTDVLEKAKETQVENTTANMNQEVNRNMPSTGEQSEVKDPEKSDGPEADQRTPDVKQGCIFVVHEKSPKTPSNNRLDELNDTQKKLINKQTENEVKHETENFISHITEKDLNINQEEGRNLLLTGDLNKLNDAERSDVPEGNQMTPDIKSGSKTVDCEMSPLPAGHDTRDPLSDVHSTVMGLTAEENKQTEGKTVKDEDPYNREENQKMISAGDQNKDNHPENKEPTVFEEKRTDSDTQDKMSIFKIKSTKSDKQENQEEKKVKHETENIKVNNTDADEQEENINQSSTGDESEVNDPETSNQPDMKHEPPSPVGHERLDERSDAQRREMDVTDESDQTEKSLDVASQENNTEQHQTRNLLEVQNKEKDPGNKEPTEFKNQRPNINHDIKPGDGETSEHDREEMIQTQDDQNDEMTKVEMLNQETEMASSHSQEELEEDDEEKRNLLPAEDQNEAKDPESEGVVEFVKMSPDVSQPLGSNRSAMSAVHYQKYMTPGKKNLGDVNTKENKQEVTVMVDQEEITNLLPTENKAEVTDPERAAPPEAEPKHNTRKCKLLIGLVTLFLVLFIVAALCIYFLLL